MLVEFFCLKFMAGCRVCALLGHALFNCYLLLPMQDEDNEVRMQINKPGQFLPHDVMLARY